MKNAKKISITILVVLFSILLIPSIIPVSGQETEQKWIQLPEEWGIEPKGGGTLIARVYREPTHFNPNYEYLVGDECYQNIFSRLVRVDTISYEIIPDLALSWIGSDDYKTYTFNLAKANWHDGEKCTAEDVKFTFDDIKEKQGYYFSTIDHIEEVEIIDDYTVVFHLSRSDSAFLSTLAHYTAPVILPKHLYEGVDPFTNPYNFEPIGTGPFKFVRWIKGSHVEYEANLDYFEGRPFLDTIIHKYIESASTFGLSLKAGESHIGYYAPPLSMLPELDEEPHITISTVSASNLLWYGFNMDREPYDDIRVRKAIAHAIDAEAYAEQIWFGYYKFNPYAYGQEGFLPWSFNPNAKMPEYDLEEAERLLDEAGYPRGSDGVRFEATIVTFTSMEAPTMAEVLKEYLKKIGIECSIEVYEFVTYKEVCIVNRKYDISCGGGNQGPDPSIWEQFVSSTGFRNSMGYVNAEVDSLFEVGSAATTIEERQAAYWRIQEIVAEELPRVTIAIYGTTFPRNNEFEGYWFEEPYHTMTGHRRLEVVWWEGGKDIPKPDDVIPEPPVDTEIEPRVKAVEDAINNVESSISSLTSQIESLKSQVESIETPPPASNTMAYVGILIALVAVGLALYQRSQ
ncbi:ABC transporter substrate-binding protein [Thermoproteota archaeon]